MPCAEKLIVRSPRSPRGCTVNAGPCGVVLAFPEAAASAVAICTDTPASSVCGCKPVAAAAEPGTGPDSVKAGIVVFYGGLQVQPAPVSFALKRKTPLG